MSTVELSRLDILLTANSSQFRQEMQGASAESTNSFEKIKSGAKAMAGVLAAAFAVDALVSWVDESVSAAIELDNLAKSVGSNAEQLQRWQSLVTKSGVEVESVSDAMSTLNEKLLEQATGGDTFLKALGISAVDAAGNLKTADAALIDISASFSQMSDGAAKSAIAADLMGDAGMKMIPVLNQGSDAIRQQIKAADELGTMLNEKTIQSMRQFKVDMVAAGQAVEATKTSILIQLMPSLSKLAGMLAETAKQSESVKVAVAGVDIVFKTVASVGAIVGGIFSVIGRTIGKLGAAVYQFISFNFKGAWETISDGGIPFFAELQQVGNELGGTLTRIWSNVDKSAASAVANLTTAKDLAVVANIAAMNASDPKKAKEPKKPKEPEYIINYTDLFADQLPALDAALLAFGTDIDFKINLDNTAQVLADYQAMADQLKQHQTVLTTDLIAIDHSRLAAAKQSITDQSLFERMLFKGDNDAKLQDAKTQFDKEVNLSALRLEALNVELREKIRLVNAAEMQMVIDADTANQQREQLTAEHHARVIQMERSKVDLQRQQWGIAQNFFSKGLDSMAAGQSKAAKVAKEVNKARALWQIAQDTRSAAMGAYNALASIPVVGPALGTAAAIAAIAFGGVQAKAVMSDSPATGSSVPTASGISSIVPTAEQPQNTEPVQRPTIAIPADNIFLGRQLVDLINEMTADGKGLNVPQFVAV